MNKITVELTEDQVNAIKGLIFWATTSANSERSDEEKAFLTRIDTTLAKAKS